MRNKRSIFSQRQVALVPRKLILHADLNNFYASVACLNQPALWEVPLAVCGDPSLRHGIVLAKNVVAKRMGVRTGQVIWQARQLCPGLKTIPPSLEGILRYSRRVRDIFGRYTDRVQPFGTDEAWLDVSGPGMDYDQGLRVANHLRHTIREETGLTVSIGVSDNRIFAKLGSDLKKPDAVTLVCQENRKAVLDPLPVSELVFVGPSTTRKLNSIGIYTVGELAAAPAEMLKALLGKTGLVLSGFARGEDGAPIPLTGQGAPVKSVGNSVTAAHDILTWQDARVTLYGLCESVASRMRKQGLVGRGVQLWMRDAQLKSCQRQCRADFDTNCSVELFALSYGLLQESWREGTPLRSLGVSVGGLSPAGAILQLSFLPEDARRQKHRMLEEAIDGIRDRYGHFAIQRAIMLADRPLGGINPQEEHVLTPDPYFQ